MGGKRADSLLGVLDRSVTSAGGRLLARWVAEPLAVVAEIFPRQQAVAALVADVERREKLREALKQTGDIARCVSRLLLGRGGPRDLAVLRGSGLVLPRLMEILNGCDGLLGAHTAPLGGLGDLTALLARALADDPLPALVRDGGFIRDGFDSELDRARQLQREGQDMLLALENREASASGIGVKVRYNQVWGYYLEATKSQLNSAQLEGKEIPAQFVHRQTTTNSQRFTTAELMALERDLASAGLRAQQREEAVLAELVAAIKAHSVALLAVSEALATLDALSTLAEVAARYGWVRPTLTDGVELAIVAGKHPVVAAKVADFVANDCELSGG
ncbi:MAG: DNA mismatch repair protein MutS, partial [Proteobacteria bacterium]|nr:DNA mismatch repair protein MutS [Pseudomonadota bacterium]